jgi:squalene synthase HpnC
MSNSARLRSGKGHGDENFPVASRLIRPRHRAVILAFYEFVRTADDIADHPSLAAGEKHLRLDGLEASLLGMGEGDLAGMTLCSMLARHNLTPRHARDLLSAFRQDVDKRRYANWDELIDYCERSAMPVGRFVLDVHGEAPDTWPVSDALCAALQIINHLQDCGRDYRTLDRVYIPQEALASFGTQAAALGADRASPALRDCLAAMAGQTTGLLRQSRELALQVRDPRLGAEIAAIHALAARLLVMLRARDPLSERVHLTKPAAIGIGAGGALLALLRRLRRPSTLAHRYQTQ